MDMQFVLQTARGRQCRRARELWGYEHVHRWRGYSKAACVRVCANSVAGQCTFSKATFLFKEQGITDSILGEKKMLKGSGPLLLSSRHRLCSVPSQMQPVRKSGASPPREKRPSALETLRVGLCVGALRRPSRLHNDGGHLDQLQGGFSVLQGLSQV